MRGIAGTCCMRAATHCRHSSADKGYPPHPTGVCSWQGMASVRESSDQQELTEEPSWVSAGACCCQTSGRPAAPLPPVPASQAEAALQLQPPEQPCQPNTPCTGALGPAPPLPVAPAAAWRIKNNGLCCLEVLQVHCRTMHVFQMAPSTSCCTCSSHCGVLALLVQAAACRVHGCWLPQQSWHFINTLQSCVFTTYTP